MFRNVLELVIKNSWTQEQAQLVCYNHILYNNITSYQPGMIIIWLILVYLIPTNFNIFYTQIEQHLSSLLTCKERHVVSSRLWMSATHLKILWIYKKIFGISKHCPILGTSLKPSRYHSRKFFIALFMITWIFNFMMVHCHVSTTSFFFWYVLYLEHFACYNYNMWFDHYHLEYLRTCRFKDIF